MKNLKRTNSENPDFKKLVVLLDDHLNFLDGDDHEFYANLNKFESVVKAIVYYQDDDAIGCGAFKEFNENIVEIKRMYVLPEYRCKGIAANILNELENWALECNYKEGILETGNQQIDAIALYKKLGYQIISNYGQYKDVETSVCLKKIF